MGSPSYSPGCDRSPYSSTTCLLQTRNVDQAAFPTSSTPRSNSSILPPPFGFSDESKSPPQQYSEIIHPSSLSVSGLYEEIVESTELNEQAEILSDESTFLNLSASHSLERDINREFDTSEIIKGQSM